MASGSGKIMWKQPLIGAVLMAAALAIVWRYSFLTSHKNLRDLQDVPVNTRVRIAGVVTYIDRPGDRVWIQDETGATSLHIDPAGLHEGQTITVSAEKSHRYEAARGPVSNGLQHAAIVLGMPRLKLPPPSRIFINQFPRADKNGIQVQTDGVVRSALVDDHGLGQIVVATSGFEVTLTIAHPQGDYASLINADVTAVGVPEYIPKPGINQPDRRLWIAAQNAVQVTHPAPPEPLYSARTIYLDDRARAGHRVRIRGHFYRSPQGPPIIVDRYGTTSVDLAPAVTFPEGTPLEVNGFPTWDPRGVRIALFHAVAHPVSESALNEINGDSSLPDLTTARSVRDLSSTEAARAYPVKLHGVITYIDNSWTQMYVQDATGGIYIKLSAPITAQVGDLVTLHGLSNPGNFAPVVVSPRVQVERRVPLPKPLAVTAEQAAGGAADSQLVTLEGLVHTLKISENPSHPIITFELVSSLGRVHVYTSPTFSDLDHARVFEDAKVSVQGVLGSLFNARRQLIGYQLLIQQPGDVRIIEPSVQDTGALETTPITDLLRFSLHQRNGHRVKVAGEVTLASRDHIYVQDFSGGVEIRASGASIRVGDKVEAVGYPTLVGQYSPVITDAVVKPVGRSAALHPRPTNADSILETQNDSTLVTVEGRLRMVVYDPARTSLVIQSGVRTFTATLDTADHGENLRNLRDGSVLRLTGICSMLVDANRLYTVIEEDPTSFEILLRSEDDVVVVHRAPFWTMQSTLAVLAVFALLVPTILVWVLVLRRRVQLQTAALQKAAETAQAIKDLSHSMQTVTHDQRFDTRVFVRGSEDIAQLVVGFNQMLTELQSREFAKLSAEAKLQHMAMVDELTGLPNRRMLFDRVTQCLARARRQHQSIGLLYLDLDGFKAVNDKLGHKFGDLLLSQVAQRLRSRTRVSDTLARIGGDEFVLVLENIQNHEEAMAVARSLIEVLELPFELNHQWMSICASIGVAIFPDHGIESDALLQHADFAMYAAKRNGKSQIVLFGNDLGLAIRERLTLEAELRRAVAENNITVHYQPEFDLVTGNIVRFEALARWTHPELGVISPGQFIPIAEESGLIIALGAAVMSQACRDAVEWNRVTGTATQVAVNVSSVQFARDSLVEDIAHILDTTGLSPSLLQIELTESMNLTGVERSSAILNALKEMGVSVAIDDFGTGYSCLSYLPRLPFDAIKIDRSFVNDRLAQAESVAFLKSIIDMAHNLRMRVVVEGIETERELRSFVQLGADEAQGFFLGRPTAHPLQAFASSATVAGLLRSGFEIPGLAEDFLVVDE